VPEATDTVLPINTFFPMAVEKFPPEIDSKIEPAFFVRSPPPPLPPFRTPPGQSSYTTIPLAFGKIQQIPPPGQKDLFFSVKKFSSTSSLPLRRSGPPKQHHTNPKHHQTPQTPPPPPKTKTTHHFGGGGGVVFWGFGGVFLGGGVGFFWVFCVFRHLPSVETKTITLPTFYLTLMCWRKVSDSFPPRWRRASSSPIPGFGAITQRKLFLFFGLFFPSFPRTLQCRLAPRFFSRQASAFGEDKPFRRIGFPP